MLYGLKHAATAGVCGERFVLFHDSVVSGDS